MNETTALEALKQKGISLFDLENTIAGYCSTKTEGLGVITKDIQDLQDVREALFILAHRINKRIYKESCIYLSESILLCLRVLAEHETFLLSLEQEETK